MDASSAPFASKTFIEHIARGAAGIGALTYAVRLSSSHPLASLGLGIFMLLAFRGCPICWTIGLVETVYRHARPALRHADHAEPLRQNALHTK
jgi:hypothetical protein